MPFSYDYTFEANQTEGALKIELTVKGDQGTMATSEVNITLTKPEPLLNQAKEKWLIHVTTMYTKP